MNARIGFLSIALSLAASLALAQGPEAYLTVVDISAIDAESLGEDGASALLREAVERPSSLSALKHVASDVLDDDAGLGAGSLRLALESRRVRAIGESGPATRSLRGGPIGTLDVMLLEGSAEEVRAHLTFQVGEAHLDAYAPTSHSKWIGLPASGGRTAWLVPAESDDGTLYLVRLSLTPTVVGSSTGS